MQRHIKHEIALGLFFFLVLGLLAYMYQAIGGRTAAGRIRVNASFDSVMGLVPDNYVMVAGVPIGAVTDIRVDGGKARVTLHIDPAAGLRQDALARIRAKSLLGEKFVELTPQSADAPLLRDGDVLADTRSGVEIDDLLISLRPIFEQLEPMTPEIASIIGELDTLLKQVNQTGEAKRETLESILDRTDELLATAGRMLAENEADLRRSIRNLDRLSSLGASRGPALIDRLERSLARVETLVEAVPLDTLHRIPETYEKADALLATLLPVARRLEAGSTRIETIIKNLDILLERVILIDELALRKFLQQEGVNVNLTQDAASRRRIRELETDDAPGPSAP